MWVVKLGGSLYRSAHLRGWVTALATHGGGKLVVVPGGGPFADQVRAAQRRWRFDDATGHRMAMLGMAQYGLMLAGLEPNLRPAADKGAIEHVLSAGHVPVWISIGDTEGLAMPRDWSVTSDSLAARLAMRLGARDLLLVKSAKLRAQTAQAAELARRGVVDETFPGLLAEARCNCRMLSAEDYGLLAAVLSGQGKAAGAGIEA